MKKILFFLVLATIFLLPKFSFAQELKDCGQVKTQSWRGETTYDVCGTEYCKDGQWKRQCYSSENPNCRCDSQNNCEYTSSESCEVSDKKQCNEVKVGNWRGVTTYDKCGQEYCKDGVYKIQCYSSENSACRCDSQTNCEYTSGDRCGIPASTPQASPTLTRSPSPEPPLPENPSPSPFIQPALKKPVKIIISQFERDDQILDPSQPESVAKINLNFDQNGIANVRFQVNYDSSGGDVAIYYVQYKLKTTSTPSATVDTNEFLVDVIIDNNLSSQEEISNWVKDTVNNYINNKFAQAGIKHKLKVGNIYINDFSNCPPDTTRKPDVPGVIIPMFEKCEPNKDNKIRVWIGLSGRAFARPDQAVIRMLLDSDKIGNKSSRKEYTTTLTHEIGHMFSMPDYYFENVSTKKNGVVSMEIAAYVKDMMWNHFKEEAQHFSSTSKGFANQISSLPVSESSMYANKYTPKKTILKIVDDKNLPINNIKVDVFSQVSIEDHRSGSESYIPEKATFGGSTGQNGEFDLGDVYKVFDMNKGRGLSALLRITRGNEVRYMAITRSYLNYLYFQGQTETAVITKPFSSLVAYDPDKVITLQEDSLSSTKNTGNLQTTDKKSSPPKLMDFNDDGVINVFDYIEYGRRKLGL